MPPKYVYFFGNGSAEGRADMKHLLGGKGVSLAEMTILGIPLQPGLQRFLRGRRGSKRANLVEMNKRWMSFHLKTIALIEKYNTEFSKQILDGNKELIKSRYNRQKRSVTLHDKKNLDRQRCSYSSDTRTTRTMSRRALTTRG